MKKNLDNNLNVFMYKEKNIITNLTVSFERKKNIYTKNILVIMSGEMEENILKKDNTQYFIDITYYATPPNNKNYKLFIILAFNQREYKTIICNISIITNENTETIVTIIEYLKDKYNWSPNRITIDFILAELNAFKLIFPQVIIITCFFRFIKNISKRLEGLKSKNKIKKKIAKDILANFKLICFIPIRAIEPFYNSIKLKYKSNYEKLFNYFDKNYINGKKFDKSFWNYNSLIINNIEEKTIFFTNNIVESFNRTLNKKYIGACKTLFNFRNAIKDIISFYNAKTIYQEKKISITKGLEFYVKQTTNFNIITNDTLKKIKEKYKNYLKNNNFPINMNNSDLSDNTDYYEIKGEESISESEEDDNSKNSLSNKKNDEDDDNDHDGDDHGGDYDRYGDDDQNSDNNGDYEDDNYNKKKLSIIKKKLLHLIQIEKINITKV